MASGSMLGSVIRNSRVATNLTQSVDPVSGTTSTSSPSWANQRILEATANCEPTPAVSVRAQVPTRTRVWAWEAGTTTRRMRVTSVTRATRRVNGLMAGHFTVVGQSVATAGAMSGVWARIASLTLAALLALAIGGVVSAHARTVGEFIDDTRISAEVTTRLAAEPPSNFLKIDVRTETGIVTPSGTVDSSENRPRPAQIAGAVNGRKGLVNNIQVAGAATPPSSSATSSTSPATPSIDATGTVASVDPSSGTITLSDGRVLRATDRTAVYQPTTVQALKPGDHVLVRGATPATVRAPESRMGTVSRVDATRRQLVLTDGSVVRVASAASVHRGTERLTLGQIEPGAEVVIQLAPVPSASPGTAATPPAPEAAAALDATDVSVVWTPSAPAR